MSDEGQLQILRTGGGNSLAIPGVRSSLAARGRRDAELVATASQTAAEADESGEICWWCGERKDLTSDGTEGYSYCRWCASRELKILEIWNKWGFGQFGIPEGGVWDEEALRRNTQAKLEIDRWLEKVGTCIRWDEMGWYFNNDAPGVLGRVALQVGYLGEAINRRWGFDSDGNPVGEASGDDVKRRAAFALKEWKKLFEDLGLPPLRDDWWGQWSSERPGIPPLFELADEGWRASGCGRCGKKKELVLGGRVCARCGDTLDGRWQGSAATDWVLTELRHDTVHEYLYQNTSYSRMKALWASEDEAGRPWRSSTPSDDEISLMKSLWGVWVKPSAPDLICSWIRPAKPEELLRNST